LQKKVNPIETLFVVDSMTGQDAAHTAKVFADALPLTGIILTMYRFVYFYIVHILNSATKRSNTQLPEADGP
jgi:hypothetical protein